MQIWLHEGCALWPGNWFRCLYNGRKSGSELHVFLHTYIGFSYYQCNFAIFRKKNRAKNFSPRASKLRLFSIIPVHSHQIRLFELTASNEIDHKNEDWGTIKVNKAIRDRCPPSYLNHGEARSSAVAHILPECMYNTKFNELRRDILWQGTGTRRTEHDRDSWHS